MKQNIENIIYETKDNGYTVGKSLKDIYQKTYENKEQNFIEWLIQKRKDFDEQINTINSMKEQHIQKMIENLICPECFSKLRDVGFGYFTQRKCNNCNFFVNLDED